MDPSVIRQVVAELAPLGLREIIPSTMGEPLLYEHFDEFIEVCREYQVALNLTTNGTWPHRGPVGWAEKLCPVCSDIKISWNGVSARTQESIMAGSPMAQRIDDLRAVIRVRDAIGRESGHYCRLTIQCTFLEGNLAELPGLIELAGELGIDRVKGHHLWVNFAQLSTQDLRRDGASRRRWNAVVAECCEVAARISARRGRPLQLDNFTPLALTESCFTPADWACPFLGREAWVNAEGRFDPCCAPDIERRTLGSFGNVQAEGGITTIWNAEVYRTLVRDYRNRSVCGKCTLRRPPDGSG